MNLEELQQQIHNTILIEHSESVDCLSERIIKEIEQKKRRTIKGYEEEFQTLIIKKKKQYLRKHDKREFALVLLIETFGDFIYDHKFIPWLSPKLEYYPGQLGSLKNSTEKDFLPRNSLSNVVFNELFLFWIKTSIPSTNRRSDRDAEYVSKPKYLKEYKYTLEFEYCRILVVNKKCSLFFFDIL